MLCSTGVNDQVGDFVLTAVFGLPVSFWYGSDTQMRTEYYVQVSLSLFYYLSLSLARAPVHTRTQTHTHTHAHSHTHTHTHNYTLSHFQTVVKPWLSGKFHASFSASIVVASCGIDLTGWVLKTGFPLTLHTNYSKQPVVTTSVPPVSV